MLIMHWEEVCHKILDYKTKLLQIKTLTFTWVQFSEQPHLC